MKRVFFSVLLMGFLLVSASFAEYLTTADCMPQGKLVLAGAYLGDQYTPVGSNSYVSSANGLTGSNDIGLRGAGLTVTYGLTNKIELTLGYGSLGGIGSGLDIMALLGGGKIDLKLSSLIGAIKLGIKQEMLGDPFSMALGIMTKQGTIKTDFPTTLNPALVAIGYPPVSNSEKNFSQYTLGLLVSQMAIPFIPYAGVAYEVNSYSKPDANYGSSDSAFGFVVGTALFLRENIATFWEVSHRSYQPVTGGPYSLMEYAGRVAWIIN